MDIDKLRLDRRQLLKGAGGFALLSVLPGCSTASSGAAAQQVVRDAKGRRVLPWSNWSGNQACQPALRWVPKSEAQLQQLLKSSSNKVRCVGAGHSFSALVPTDEALLSLARIRGLQSADKQNQQASFGAGTRLAAMGKPLAEQGLALPNMPDINTQALAGAIATSTHGTGANYGSMSSTVSAMRMVLADGEVLNVSAQENSQLLNAVRHNIGALGVVTEITLQTQDAFNLEEKTWVLPLAEAMQQAEAMRDSIRHFEMYFFPHADYAMMISIEQTDKPVADIFEPKASGEDDDALRSVVSITKWLPFLRGPIINSALKDVAMQSRVGRSYEIYGNSRTMRFNEMEYSVPAVDGLACIEEILHTIKRKSIDVIFPIEYRYVQADEVWLSPFYQRDSCSISCHNFHDLDYKTYFSKIEPIFNKYQGRPHWGKLHTLTASQFADKYPRFEDFLSLRKQLDPKGRFLNAHLESVLRIV